MAVENEAKEYDSLFALMSQSDDNEEDDNDEVNFRVVQRHLKSYSSKKLMSLANVLIDAYYSLVNYKDVLTIELGDVEQSRDDLVVCVVDLNKTIEHERNDLEKTVKNLSKEKNTLEEKIAATEQERDDFLVGITDLEETIEVLKSEHSILSIGKGKEVSRETHIKLEKELNDVKTSLRGELEKNRKLQAELEKVKIDFEKSLKWTWSSDAITVMYFNNSGNSKAYKVYNRRTQCVEESVHVLFNETPSSNKEGNSDNQDNEPLLVLGKIFDVSNGKADIMSQIKETNKIKNQKFPSLLSISIPNRTQNIKEALKDADWITAMQEELHQFERNKEEGIDYDKTFAPVARMEAIRILIAFASHMEFTLFQLDVKSVFLNGFLKEEVYVKQPSGFECQVHPEYVFKLDKALYGLKKAPRVC
uniref:Uncharacterized protein LOC104232507 n=1 Tax=Nicotiana sylvestris TaxID=4096 RepID=A0A1U7XAT0_NICSY|nr:PREDICTED: uncharacterized protein LOC104232507 [Nicotiana sylvestris]